MKKLDRQLKPRKTNPKNRSKVDDCTIPRTNIPPTVLPRYTLEGDSHLTQEVRNYVGIEAPDESVEHVELVKEEVVLGIKYQVWDVTTDKHQWWVISDPMNLYDRGHFQSLDYTISFHIGLMARVTSRNAKIESRDIEPFDELARRRDQAQDRLDSAIESEDFQAVGLMLRENLILLAGVLKHWLPPDQQGESLKGGDFKGWAEFHISKVCAGSSNKQLRHYLKCISIETWQLVNWLTHDTNANKNSATIALHSVDTLIGHLTTLLVRNRTHEIDSCPRCSSHDVRQHFDRLIPPDGDYYTSCGSCGWQSKIEE